jgi:hypothetical protein
MAPTVIILLLWRVKRVTAVIATSVSWCWCEVLPIHRGQRSEAMRYLCHLSTLSHLLYFRHSRSDTKLRLAFCRSQIGISALLRYYPAYRGDSLPTFRNNESAPFSGIKIAKKNIKSKISWPLKVGRIGCPETSGRNCVYTLRYITEQRIYQRYILAHRQEGRKIYWVPMTEPFGLGNMVFCVSRNCEKPGNPGKRMCTERDLLVKRVDST